MPLRGWWRNECARARPSLHRLRVLSIDVGVSGVAQSSRGRFFYPACAGTFLFLMVIGFLPFYHGGKAYGGHDLPHSIRTLTILHAMSMTAWVLLFQMQTALIAMGRHQCHKIMGRVGALLALSILLLGWRMAMAAALISPPDLSIAGLLPRQFMIVPVFNILAFAALTLLGLSLRRHSHAHRPLMLLATLATLSAAISRIDFVTMLYQGTMWQRLFGPFFGMLVLGGLFLVISLLVNRRLDYWYAGGYAVLVAGAALTLSLAKTNGWDAIALWLLDRS
jgi:hypothetical protein